MLALEENFTSNRKAPRAGFIRRAKARNTWLPMVPDTAATAAFSASIVASRGHFRKVRDKPSDARITSWENEGGGLAPPLD